jgi:F0F1-type ATP synthase membrane subunit b/b'
MMTPEILAAFGQFGPLGLVIGYLIWREKAGAEKRGEIERERVEADKTRAEADKALAGALAALTVMIQHLDQRLK